MGGGQSKQNEIGTKLYITVYRAVNLRAGLMRRPFVKLIVGTKYITTSFGKGTRPMFMERFCFDYEALDGDIVAQVWDSGFCFSNELLGEVQFPAEAFLQSEKRKTFKLFTEKHGYQGSLHLSVFLCPAGFTATKKDTKVSVINEGIIQPPKPLFSPINAQTPVLPYYCRINYPSPDSIMEKPKEFGFFLIDRRSEASVSEKADIDKLKQAIKQLNDEKNEYQIEDREKRDVIVSRLETIMAHAQIAADVQFLNLNQTEKEASDIAQQLAQLEWDNFLKSKKVSDLEEKREEMKKLLDKQKQKKKKKEEKLLALKKQQQKHNDSQSIADMEEIADEDEEQEEEQNDEEEES
ncbi:MAG: hypothetical protein EZS28_023474 [Streblomastix strix]|uniref:C2 domain-containing protein n=1 Tax=Streblomastix strix TaxID=222440 RepID=A0A5J4VEG6_9EUKA|nr:MAG: hypothetical protein EZS28_023474 [Streblomastix strix]